MDTHKEPGLREQPDQRGIGVSVLPGVAGAVDYDKMIIESLGDQGLIDDASKPFLKKSPKVVKLAGAFAEFHRQHPNLNEEGLSLLMYLMYQLVLALMDSENRLDNE